MSMGPTTHAGLVAHTLEEHGPALPPATETVRRYHRTPWRVHGGLEPPGPETWTRDRDLT
jgi:hypothetical protein